MVVVMHFKQGRAYLKIETYVRAARPLINALGITTILLLTDSSIAVEEALRCAEDYPSVCGGLQWRYIEKQRWKGAEGGWENGFPSGNSTIEFLHIQEELALAQQCSMAILGESGYGNLVHAHMCCGFPLAPRGNLPHRCICPLSVNLNQKNYNCETGNMLQCQTSSQDTSSLTTYDLIKIGSMNFSLSNSAYRENPLVWIKGPGENRIKYKLSELHDNSTMINNIKDFIQSQLDEYHTYRYKKIY